MGEISGFEGAEKRVEVVFHRFDDLKSSLRELDREFWDKICALCKCTIVEFDRYKEFDSYILSESSLFVYEDRVLIKTCGTTVPLNCLSELVQAAQCKNMQLESVMHSHRSFKFPMRQVFPHTSVADEVVFLKSLNLNSYKGDNALVGPQDDLFWFVHKEKFALSSSSISPSFSKKGQLTIDIMMTGLSDNSRLHYYQDFSRPEDQNEIRMSETMKKILPEFFSSESRGHLRGKSYDTCGYSCNGYCLDSAHKNEENQGRYVSVHITPEADFSYASIETCISNDTVDAYLPELIDRIVDFFDPAEFCVAVIDEIGGSAYYLPSEQRNSSLLSWQPTCNDEDGSSDNNRDEDEEEAESTTDSSFSSSPARSQEIKIRKPAAKYLYDRYYNLTHYASKILCGDTTASTAFYTNIRFGLSGRKPTGVL